MTRLVKRLNGRTVLPEGYPFLVYDDEDDRWSLWMGEHMHVSISVTVYENPEMDDGTWGTCYLAVAITHEEFEQAKMAARHIRTSDAWQRFAKRIADEPIINLCVTTMPRANTGE